MLHFSKQFSRVTQNIFEIKEKNQKICLYGYGSFAKYVKSILGSQVIAIFDKNYKELNSLENEILNPYNINQINYDKVIICVLGREDEILQLFIDELKISTSKIITFNHDYIIRKELVLIHQMGKVASTSLLNSIRMQGFETYHCHYLSNELFQYYFDLLLNTEIPLETFNAQKELFCRYFSLKRKVEDSQSLRVITLSRKTDDWYWSSKLQGYNGFIQKVHKFCRMENKYFAQDEESLRYYFSQLLQLIKKHNFSIVDLLQIDNSNKLFQKNSRDWILFSEITSLIYQLKWFDIEINRFYNVNIYREKFLDDYLILKNGAVEILLLKYESLGRLHHVIGNFLNIDAFSLTRDNVSSKKDSFSTILSIKNEFNFKIMNTLKLTDTEYYRFFGYELK